MTWSAALITPILASALISSVWLLQAASLSSHLRPTAIKFLIYLIACTGTCSLVLFNLVYFESIAVWFEWILSVGIVATTMIAVVALVPKMNKKKTPKTSGNNTTMQQSWMQIDNRSSVADFRYIPVVHNVHSTNYYQKPKSIERLYTEIIPERNDVIENGQSNVRLSQSMMSHHETLMSHPMSNNLRMTMPNQITCNNPNVDWTNQIPPFHLRNDSFQSKHSMTHHPEDSGVHTAQNSSDSASSDRNSPIVEHQTLPEQKQSLLEQSHHRQSSMGDIHV